MEVSTDVPSFERDDIEILVAADLLTINGKQKSGKTNGQYKESSHE